jgi:hypothetical protein
MRLDHWRIDLDFDGDAGEGNNAMVWRSYAYDDATIYLDPEWRDRDERAMAQTLLHELGHVLCRDLDRAALSVDAELGEAFAHFERRYKHESEGVVDRYAELLVDLLGF